MKEALSDYNKLALFDELNRFSPEDTGSLNLFRDFGIEIEEVDIHFGVQLSAVGAAISSYFIADRDGLVFWVDPEMRAFMDTILKDPEAVLNTSGASHLLAKSDLFRSILECEIPSLNVRQKQFEGWRDEILMDKGLLEPFAAMAKIAESAKRFDLTEDQAYFFLRRLMHPGPRFYSLFFSETQAEIETLLTFSAAPSQKPDKEDVLRAAADLEYICHDATHIEDKSSLPMLAAAIHSGHKWLRPDNPLEQYMGLLYITPHIPYLPPETKRSQMTKHAENALLVSNRKSNHAALQIFTELNNQIVGNAIGAPLSRAEREEILANLRRNFDAPF